jgi:hypothetical protein
MQRVCIQFPIRVHPRNPRFLFFRMKKTRTRAFAILKRPGSRDKWRADYVRLAAFSRLFCRPTLPRKFRYNSIAMQNADPSQSEPTVRRRTSRLRNYAIGIVLGSLVAIVGLIVIAVASRSKELPPITFELLDAAVSRWSANGPSDYDMEIELTGINPGIAHVEVRHGNVTAMTLNDRPTKPHIWDDWSIPGLFTIIRRDLEVCMAPNRSLSSAKAQPDSPSPRGEGENAKVEGGGGKADTAFQPDPVAPRGLFDPQLGYPVQYHRVTPTGADAKWRITRFTLHSAS